ncbi:RluA family pseudouridine synthase [Rhodovibrio salinarum]|uniref:Pseudouridine synthase n=1 Tax=Rhodovibrio salinarum TaxID=1087 RepID=A0A934V244_9PROT|nr:RluA family pseudouridine synthase [Rhodovibrio salinarum]MBK1698564.1 RluA family pseudouridine synthase [Rhodovibrio salinarum]
MTAPHPADFDAPADDTAEHGPESPDAPAAPSAVHSVEVDPEADGQRIDRVLTAALPQLSRSRLQALIQAGCVSADARTIAEPKTRVKAGQRLAVTVPPAAPAAPEGEAIPLDVVYEDAALIVVDKPAGLVVHPAPGNETGTLVNALIAHCGDSLQGIGGERRPGIVHRLDKDTSGLMVAAKTDVAHQALVAQFAEREIDRAYRALCWGVPDPVRGRLTGDIGRSPQNRKKMAVVERGGRPAATQYQVLRTLARGAVAELTCKLETGRTHQVRVHLAEAGHALLGDPTYGRQRTRVLRELPEAAQQAVRGFTRQALHAERLGFAHPDDGRWCAFERSVPEDLQQVIDALSRVT